MIPFFAAFCSLEEREAKKVLASLNLFCDKRSLNDFISVFISEVTVVFLACFFLDFRISLQADLFCGILVLFIEVSSGAYFIIGECFCQIKD